MELTAFSCGITPSASKAPTNRATCSAETKHLMLRSSSRIIRSDLKFHGHSLQQELKAPTRTHHRSASRAPGPSSTRLPRAPWHRAPGAEPQGKAPGHAGAQEAAEHWALNAASQCITSHRGKMSLCQILPYQETDARQLWVAERGLDTSTARAAGSRTAVWSLGCSA